MSSTEESSGFSVAKTLTKLLAIPTNRSCADCKVTLVDSSQVHASFSPNIATSTRSLFSPKRNNFKLNHRLFAPPGKGVSLRTGNGAVNIPDEEVDPPVDPCLIAANLTGGHGVFVCSLCGSAHKRLGLRYAVVYPVQSPAMWTKEEAQSLSQAGGNQRSWDVFERCLPSTWEVERPHAGSTAVERLAFIRAKYESLAFILPQPGPLAKSAWNSILYKHSEWNGFWGAGVDRHSIAQLNLKAPALVSSGTRTRPSVTKVATVTTVRGSEPERLVEYFCVVAPSDFLDREEVDRDLSVRRSPDELLLEPIVVDCYPPKGTHQDLEFPEQIGTFVSPDGCRPSSKALPPSFFTFVLTSASGDLLYGGALRLYDDDHDTNGLRQTLKNSGYSGALPPFLVDNNNSVRSKESPSSSNNSDVIFLPKCLVVLSRYPFFDLWRQFLLQIYRIALVEAPLPIERFIANFVSEVPLPPPGKIQVRCGFTFKNMWTIERPPLNQLPMANFSFQPLFATLSVSNVMIVWACLLQESRVTLLSKHCAILGPVAEALLSFLFPFHWQGLYIPVMPYKMLDILDAPVPYLVGLDSQYLVDTPPQNRPRGVIFVDLDKDIVHLGLDDGSSKARLAPVLPERDALKLKSKLTEFAAGVYAMPESTRVGTVTTGDQCSRLPHIHRPTYLNADYTNINPSLACRQDILGATDKAYQENELLVPISGFLSEHGHFYELEKQQSRSSGNAKTGPRFLRLNALKRNSSSPDLTDSFAAYKNLLGMDEAPGFCSTEIRSAFLRFFVSVFRDYRQYLEKSSFRSAEFLGSLNASVRGIEFVREILETQMFERFLEDRRQGPEDPEVVFFDESINAKMNRSKKTQLTNIAHGEKTCTAFLDDTSGVITEHFAPPPPSNWGLPDEGHIYHYGSFPKLNPSLFGKTRSPRKWKQNRRASFRRLSITTDEAIMARSNRSQSIVSATKRRVKNFESAMGALSVSLGKKKGPASTEKSKISRVNKRSANAGFSDISLPDVLGQSSKFLSAAEEVSLNVRRKQAILLVIIVKFQTIWRGRLCRNRANLLLTERTPQVHAQISHLERCKCATTVQRMLRMQRARERFRKMRKAIIDVQSRVRCRRVRFAYELLLQSVARVQGFIRAFVTRHWVSVVLEERITTYREQVFSLWKHSNTPLSYRTKFWPLIQLTTSSRVKLAESELMRLWKELSIELPPNATRYGKEAHGALLRGESLGLSNAVYRRALNVAALLMTNDLPMTRTENAPNCGIANGERKVSRRGSVTWGSHTATSRIAAERLQIYERLSAQMSARYNDTQDLLDFFVNFQIPRKEKRKKVQLAEIVWCSYNQADLSTSFMIYIFPELRESTNINFVEPSKKGNRRFLGKSPESRPEPLERSMWAHTFLDEQIRQNVYEVAAASLLRVPSLAIRLAILERPEDCFGRRQQVEAAMNTRCISDWPRCRLAIIKEFLYINETW